MMNCEFGDPIILLYLAVKLARSLDALGTADVGKSISSLGVSMPGV